MNQGQKMFHDFYMNMVETGKEVLAEELLSAGFQKQEEGTFAEFIDKSKDKYFELIREDCRPELEKAMSHFLGKQ